jgi:hypothetical protein
MLSTSDVVCLFKNVKAFARKKSSVLRSSSPKRSITAHLVSLNHVCLQAVVPAAKFFLKPARFSPLSNDGKHGVAVMILLGSTTYKMCREECD